MVKVYCDRCGKKLNTDDQHYYPLVEAAKGEEIFFTISMHNRTMPPKYDTWNDAIKPIDLSDIRYDYNAPDLCPECMRVISDAVKTVWDGKKKEDLTNE